MTGVEEELKLIRQIVAGGGRKYTAGNIDRSRYDRLVHLGWLIPFKINISDVEYQVTDEGRAAAALSDESAESYYGSIRQQAETDRVHKRHFTANPTVRERAKKLIRRKLLAKRKLSAGDLARMIRDRLDDFSYKITVYRAVSGSHWSSWG